MGLIPNRWKTISSVDNANAQTAAMNVPGGCLIREWYFDEAATGVTLVFLPGVEVMLERVSNLYSLRHGHPKNLSEPDE